MKELAFRRGFDDMRPAEQSALDAVLRHHPEEFSDDDIKKLRVVAWPLVQGAPSSRYDVMFRIKEPEGLIAVVAAIRLEDDSFQAIGYLFEASDTKFKFFVLTTGHNGFSDLMWRSRLEGEVLQFENGEYVKVGPAKKAASPKRKVSTAKSKSNKAVVKKRVDRKKAAKKKVSKKMVSKRKVARKKGAKKTAASKR